jgi:hypothetical protein
MWEGLRPYINSALKSTCPSSQNARVRWASRISRGRFSAPPAVLGAHPLHRRERGGGKKVARPSRHYCEDTRLCGRPIG